MSKITVIDQTDFAGNITQIVNIENDDGSLTSMPKSVWDELNANTEGTR